MTDVNCIPVQGQNWQRADEVVIGQGIQYLRDNHLTCWVGAHSCVRVSCSYNAAIYLCNNVSIPITKWNTSCADMFLECL